MKPEKKPDRVLEPRRIRLPIENFTGEFLSEQHPPAADEPPWLCPLDVIANESAAGDTISVGEDHVVRLGTADRTVENPGLSESPVLVPQVANGQTAVGELAYNSLHARPGSVVGQGQREVGLGLPEISLEHPPQFALGSVDREDHFYSVREHSLTLFQELS